MRGLEWVIFFGLLALLVVAIDQRWKWSPRWGDLWLDLGWFPAEPLVVFQVILCEWTGEFFTVFLVHVARFVVTLGVDMTTVTGGSMVDNDVE